MEQVDALGVVEARISGTEADVRLASLSRPSRRTGAQEGVNLVSASGAVQTGTRGALVHVVLAKLAHEAWIARALEAVVQVDASAGADRRAGVVGAVIDARLAVKADESRTTLAHEAVR